MAEREREAHAIAIQRQRSQLLVEIGMLHGSHDNYDRFFDNFVSMNYVYNLLLNSFKILLHV